MYDKSYSPEQVVQHNDHRDILSSSGYSHVFRGDNSDNPALYEHSGTLQVHSLVPNGSQNRLNQADPAPEPVTEHEGSGDS